MASWYNIGHKQVMSGELDLLTDTLKVMLVTTGYTFDPDHAAVSAPAAFEASGMGYSAGFSGSGRKDVTAKTVTQDDAQDRSVFDAADILWTVMDVGIIGGVVLYKHQGNDASSIPIAYFGSSQLTNGSDVTLRWSSSGVLDFKTT